MFCFPLFISSHLILKETPFSPTHHKCPLRNPAGGCELSHFTVQMQLLGYQKSSPLIGCYIVAIICPQHNSTVLRGATNKVSESKIIHTHISVILIKFWEESIFYIIIINLQKVVILVHFSFSLFMRTLVTSGGKVIRPIFHLYYCNSLLLVLRLFLFGQYFYLFICYWLA